MKFDRRHVIRDIRPHYFCLVPQRTSQDRPGKVSRSNRLQTRFSTRSWPHVRILLYRLAASLQVEENSSAIAFPNTRGSSLTRDGVNYILQQAVERAALTCPSLKNKRVFPHIFRHSCALHLLQSGIDIAVIALWLGHESIQTTHGYIEADMAIKERALQKLAPAGKAITRFKADDALLTFLASL
jgi:integrase